MAGGPAATVRAENRQQASTEAAILSRAQSTAQHSTEHRSSYFQTGPDVMTEPNLNTGKSVQICQKRGSSSCKERPPMNRGVGFGNERELKSKIKSPFSKLLPQAFSSYCFSNLFSISTTHWSQFLFWRHNEGMSGTIHFTGRKSFSIGGSAFSPFPEY